MHSFAASRNSHVSYDYIQNLRMEFSSQGAIKRLNKNRKEFGDATGLCEERTQREEEEEKEEDHFLLFH